MIVSVLIAAFAILVPRVTLFVIFLLTDWFSKTYETSLWPFLGFFFMPYTTLAYMFAMYGDKTVTGLDLVVVMIAVLLDLGFLTHTEE